MFVCCFMCVLYLDDVVGVDAVQLSDVDSDLRVGGDCSVELADQLCIVGTYTFGGQVKSVCKVWTAGKVEDNFDESFVERCDEVAETTNALLGASSLGQGHSEGNTDVLVRVVIIDFIVTVRFDLNQVRKKEEMPHNRDDHQNGAQNETSGGKDKLCRKTESLPRCRIDHGY